jgi:Uma2 family endonuclease
MSITINPPAGPWTIGDLDRIHDLGLRVEIHEGNLLIMSPATRWHSRVIRRITRALEAQGHDVEMEVGVKRSDQNTRIADVAIFAKTQTDSRRAHWEPEELRLVVEVVSESSEEEDRATKPRWYAMAGIPEFWRAERTQNDDDAVIFQFKLASTANGEAAYVQTGTTTLSALENPAL